VNAPVAAAPERSAAAQEPAQAAAQQQPTAAQPTTPAAPGAGPQAAAVPQQSASVAPAPAPNALSHANLAATVERVHELVHIVATRGGHARATLHLKPVELGSVDVRLRTTNDGLVATIAAHDNNAAEALQQAGGDLRRALEARGVTLVRLDITIAAEAGGQGAGAALNGDPRAANSHLHGNGRTRAGGHDDAIDAVDDPTSDIPTVTTARAGALVDVHA
jgi:flagellar hook-length control protein FliK